MAEAQKGVFDHLADYLRQPNADGSVPPPAALAAPAPADAVEAPATEQRPGPVPASMNKESQTLVFLETAEKLVVEKELFVREQVVLSRLIEDHVQAISDTVRRTEVEIDRLSPEEAERIQTRSVPTDSAPAASSLGAAESPAPVAPPRAVEAAEAAVPPSSEAPTARSVRAAPNPERPAGQHSASWWLWFGLILIAAVLIAFAAGQFLGSASS